MNPNFAPRPAARFAVFGLLVLIAASFVFAEEPASSAGPFLRLLKSGRLPPEGQSNLIKLICARGNASDLEYIFQQAVAADGFAEEARAAALAGLEDAALNRKVKPSGDLAGLGRLIQAADESAATRVAAIRLAGAWKSAAAASTLESIALDAGASADLRQAALDALARLGGQTARATISKLTSPDQPTSTRFLGVAALASFDLDQAASRAAEVLAAATEKDDPAPLVRGFLNQQHGAEKLAEALAQQKPSPDVAKLALRYMYSIGRTDESLGGVLGEAAGINTQVQELSLEEKQQLIDDVATLGDAARGERVFRRNDLSCMKCHSVSGAGGDIGPDLSGVGASSPSEYIIEAILLPDKAVKEEFLAITVFDVNGRVFTGIVEERDDNHVKLKDATGKRIVIPADDIDEEIKGRSLMPKGLAGFMTRSELLDVARFISELGKPGPYAIRQNPTFQRWRVLNPVPTTLAATVPDEATFRRLVLQADEVQWEPEYGMVNGVLPLDELVRPDREVLYVRSDIDVTSPGEVGIQLNSADGVHLWVDGQPLAAAEQVTADLSVGRHQVTFRIDTTERKSLELLVELFDVPGSTSSAAVIKGR